MFYLPPRAAEALVFVILKMKRLAAQEGGNGGSGLIIVRYPV
jgi:hypothetical protein